MNARFRLSIVALIFAGVLAGCASVAEGTQFQAPSGWTGTPSIMGRVQMWIKSGKTKDDSQFLMLYKGSATDKVDFNGLTSTTNTKDVKVLSRGPAKFCGSQEGQAFRAVGTDKDGKRAAIEITTSLIGKDRYTAVYIHPVGVPADQQAETAVNSLCPTAAK